MSKLIFFWTLLGLFAACGLSYVPQETKEDLTASRKQTIEQYIANAYKDSVVEYKSLFYGETTVVKPESYKTLDSLYEIKYQNELKGLFDRRLEEVIGNQRNVIIQDAPKLRYIENHIYAVNTQTESEINYCDIELNGKNEVTAFQITEQHTIPLEFLELYQILLNRESFLNPGYLADNDEQNFYSDFDEYRNSLPFDKQNDFLIHQLKVMSVAQKMRTLDTEVLIKELCISEIFNRKYDTSKDTFVSIDGLLVDKVLTEYLIVLSTEKKKYLLKYSPYLELLQSRITE